MTNETKRAPRWSSTTKMVVGLTLVAAIAMVLISFRNLIGPLLLSVIIAYLIYPLADGFRKVIRIPWAISVSIVFVLVVVSILGLLTWGGFSIIEPIQNFIKFLEKTVNDLPEFLAQMKQWSFSLGRFEFSLQSINFTELGNMLLEQIQPIISQAGSMVGAIASGAASSLVMVGFIIIVSYFLLVETKGMRDNVIKLEIPGYQADLNRLGQSLGRIWNAFIRGQFLVTVVTIVFYTIFLSIFGVHFAIGLAIMAGFARFIPYVGSAATWLTYFLVAYLQGPTIFGLDPFWYSVMVLSIALIVDTIIDNVLIPRLYANVLSVHPAAVLVAILISAQWLGVIGLIVAAPVLASLRLFLNYALKKMVDQDPWELIAEEEKEPLKVIPIEEWAIGSWTFLKKWSGEARVFVRIWGAKLWKIIKSWFMMLINKITGKNPEEKTDD